MIYLSAKIWQECKQRKNHVLVAVPINIVHQHHPCLNNLQFNPIIVKSKAFLFHSILSLLFIITSVFLHRLKLIKMYEKEQYIQVSLFNFYYSIVLPLNIYLKNSSLRKYLWNDFLNDLLCTWIVILEIKTIALYMRFLANIMDVCYIF